MVEERSVSLIETQANTRTEEPLFVVTPDFVNEHAVDDDIQDDPFCSQGFITAFRNFVPLSEPVYLAAAQTFAGDLVEMERIIGDAIYSGYVGYNGRTLRTTAAISGEGAGDTRHTIVAYFLIAQAGFELQLPWRVCELAVRIFRHVVNSMSMRNRSTDTLAAACLVCAIERARHRGDVLVNRDAARSAAKLPQWQQVVETMQEEYKDVLKYLQLVNQSLQRGTSRPSGKMLGLVGSVCTSLALPTSTKELATAMLELVVEKGVCERRNLNSVCAGAVFLAAQVHESTRKTQADVAKASSTSEVTLRKVCRELLQRYSDIAPSQEVSEQLERRFKTQIGAAQAEEDPSKLAAEQKRVHPVRHVSEVAADARQAAPALSRIALNTHDVQKEPYESQNLKAPSHQEQQQTTEHSSKPTISAIGPSSIHTSELQSPDAVLRAMPPPPQPPPLPRAR